MASSASGKLSEPGWRPSFHLWLVLAMCMFVFLGFGLTYLVPMATGARTDDPPVVHLHGIVFFSWMVLLLVQSALVNARNVKLHRSLGTFGIAVGTMVVATGLLITIVGASTTVLQGSGGGVFYLSVVAPPSFGLIFALAIRAVRTPMVHRGLMLIATVAILMPGINRVYMAGLGALDVPFFATYMTMNVFLVLVLWHERRATGGISGTTWLGAGIVVVPQIAMPFVSWTPWWAEFIYWLGDLAYYRGA